MNYFEVGTVTEEELTYYQCELVSSCDNTQAVQELVSNV
jgi:hypothetical protein